MTRRILAPLALTLLALAACPKDKKEARDTVAQIPVDTVPTDLSQVTSNIPEALPDTFRKRTPVASPSTGSRGAAIPPAPAALTDAVQRELSFQRFCFQEFGQKADPSLSGNVAMVVTVGSGGITDTRIGDSRWSSGAAGRAVNNCLADKAKQAWHLEPGAVRAGRYVVQLSFRGA